MANDVGFADDNAVANDACLGRIMANIASLREHHFEQSEKHHIATGDTSLKYSDFYDRIDLTKVKSVHRYKSLARFENTSFIIAEELLMEFMMTGYS